METSLIFANEKDSKISSLIIFSLSSVHWKRRQALDADLQNHNIPKFKFFISLLSSYATLAILTSMQKSILYSEAVGAQNKNKTIGADRGAKWQKLLNNNGTKVMVYFFLLFLVQLSDVECKNLHRPLLNRFSYF